MALEWKAFLKHLQSISSLCPDLNENVLAKMILKLYTLYVEPSLPVEVHKKNYNLFDSSEK